jgi:hypothetical protein
LFTPALSGSPAGEVTTSRRTLLLVIAAWIGHTDVSLTMRLYALAYLRHPLFTVTRRSAAANIQQGSGFAGKVYA